MHNTRIISVCLAIVGACFIMLMVAINQRSESHKFAEYSSCEDLLEHLHNVINSTKQLLYEIHSLSPARTQDNQQLVKISTLSVKFEEMMSKLGGSFEAELVKQGHVIQKLTETVEHLKVEMNQTGFQTKKTQHIEQLESDKCKAIDDTQVINVFNLFKDSLVNATCVPLRLHLHPSQVQICVHPTYEDKYVSGDIVSMGIFERTGTHLFRNILLQNPDLQVIDIGANIGLYTLIAASLGRKVVAVEPYNPNIQRLHKSVKVNKFEKNVLLVTNPVSNDRAMVSFNLVKGNIGATQLKQLSKTERKLETDCNDGLPTTYSIYLDDLVTIIPFTKAVLKIDIEGYEVKALQKAIELFKQIDIPFVFIEWMHIKKDPDVNDLVHFFIQQGLKPFSVQLAPLELGNVTTWPVDVLWARVIE